MYGKPLQGTRSQALLALAIIWALTAVRLMVTPPDDRNPALFHTQFPVELRAAVWGIPALVAAVAAFWRRWDQTAWWVVIVPPTERLTSFLIGWALLGAGNRALGGVLLYGALTFLINRCAKGLDRPPELPAAPPLAGPTGKV